MLVFNAYYKGKVHIFCFQISITKLEFRHIQMACNSPITICICYQQLHVVAINIACYISTCAYKVFNFYEATLQATCSETCTSDIITLVNLNPMSKQSIPNKYVYLSCNDTARTFPIKNTILLEYMRETYMYMELFACGFYTTSSMLTWVTVIGQMIMHVTLQLVSLTGLITHLPALPPIISTISNMSHEVHYVLHNLHTVRLSSRRPFTSI